MIKCEGYRIEYIDGTEFDCKYQNATFGCEDCILTGGLYSPQTGKIFRGNRKKYIKQARIRKKQKESNFLIDRIDMLYK